MGECPEWYGVIRAARYLRVAPWELEDQPFCWQEWALEAEDAEAKAEKAREARDARRIKRGGR